MAAESTEVRNADDTAPGTVIVRETQRDCSSRKSSPAPIVSSRTSR